MQPQDWDHELKLGEKTDVWGIGSIAWSLLCNKQATSDGPIRCHSISASSTDPSSERKKVPLALVCPQNFTINDETTVLAMESSAQFTAGKYGQEIKDLVRRCLNHGHFARPTLREIIAEADHILTGNADLENQMMDAGGLHLVLPDTSALAIGQPVYAAKRK
jgi:serine/threonine protein kinase